MFKTKSDYDAPLPKVDWRELKKKKKEWKEAKELKRLKQEKRKEEEEEEKEEKEEKEEEVIKEDDYNQNGTNYTLSVALPASILNNAQSPELKTYLIGQIARACAIYNCDEIVLYDEYGSSNHTSDEYLGSLEGDKKKKCLVKMARVLQYLECPQYIRKYLFPLHQDLKYAGLLNPLDCIHHLRESDECKYREGVISTHKVSEKGGSYVNVGLKKDIFIEESLLPGVRVTIEYEPSQLSSGKKKIKGKSVPPNTPKIKSGLYWGYSVRIASSFYTIFTECPYDGGYDLTIGTSERGDNIDETELPSNFKHCIVVFGGLKGLEATIEVDERYSNVDDARKLFNYYLNTCPNQGSHTIRTEEAILISLSALRPKLVLNLK